MLPLLLIIFVLVPIAELAVIIQVGQEIGVWWTIAILIADSILGAMLMRSQGRIAWRRFNEALQAGRPPAREVLDGVLVIFGGAFLLTPGFITDIFGADLPDPADARDRAPAAGAALLGADDRGRAHPRRDVDHAARGRRRHRGRRRYRAPAAEHAVSEPVLTGGEGFTDAMTFAFADREAGFFGLARAGVADGQGSALGVLFAGREPVSLVAEGDHAVSGRGLG